ncbi:hypothetical protein OVA15_01590 [Kocuria sp. SL71]|nr:hypothetical protein [Kocuria sp. SL71]MCY1683115.1 hypothetical protein [Kocuria sp. SL71]
MGGGGVELRTDALRFLLQLGEGLGKTGLQLPQPGEGLLLLLERPLRIPRAADDLREPGALVVLGVRDVVVELLLQREAGPHVLLGLPDRLLEGGDLRLAVLQTGELELLLRVLDRVVGGDDLLPGADAQLLDRDIGELAVARLAGLALLLTLAGALPVHSPGHAKDERDEDRGQADQQDQQHGAEGQAPVAAVGGAAGAPCGLVEALDGTGHRPVPVVVGQLGDDLVLIDAVLLVEADAAAVAGQEARLPIFGGHRQQGIRAAHPAGEPGLLDPFVGGGGICELVDDHDAERDALILGELVDLLLEPGGILEDARVVDDALVAGQVDRRLRPGRGGRAEHSDGPEGADDAALCGTGSAAGPAAVLRHGLRGVGRVRRAPEHPMDEGIRDVVSVTHRRV